MVKLELASPKCLVPEGVEAESLSSLLNHLLGIGFCVSKKTRAGCLCCLCVGCNQNYRRKQGEQYLRSFHRNVLTFLSGELVCTPALSAVSAIGKRFVLTGVFE
ncbi:MAG: hypothetical protein DMG97_38705 [Acidobacteria bacterium]|nr:MAG: hypothetical protein DMG97_38705 [Acidobacteriota bacterium]